MTHRPRESATAERRARYRRGIFSELLAAAFLTLKGYRIVGRRERTPLGEIDLIAVRRHRIAFVEVKARQSEALAREAVGWRQERRTVDAADLWLARRPHYHDFEIGFDIVLVVPGRWPRHIENGLR